MSTLSQENTEKTQESKEKRIFKFKIHQNVSEAGKSKNVFEKQTKIDSFLKNKIKPIKIFNDKTGLKRFSICFSLIYPKTILNFHFIY